MTSASTKLRVQGKLLIPRGFLKQDGFTTRGLQRYVYATKLLVKCSVPVGMFGCSMQERDRCVGGSKAEGI